MADKGHQLIEALENEWRDALCSKDVERLRALVHPDFVLIGTRSTGPFTMPDAREPGDRLGIGLGCGLQCGIGKQGQHRIGVIGPRLVKGKICSQMRRVND